ncbi:unnamed protein product [Trichogramma brassicae]|uniref:Uncharacterized protein n=1 Tax=Trichogramma brassicae TaxID=86971 RepID=A0A6H5IS87_9HYME|nr:unnamed protein product [Trichogramma brassicae]
MQINANISRAQCKSPFGWSYKPIVQFDDTAVSTSKNSHTCDELHSKRNAIATCSHVSHQKNVWTRNVCVARAELNVSFFVPVIRTNTYSASRTNTNEKQWIVFYQLREKDDQDDVDQDDDGRDTNKLPELPKVKTMVTEEDYLKLRKCLNKSIDTEPALQFFLQHYDGNGENLKLLFMFIDDID